MRCLDKATISMQLLIRTIHDHIVGLLVVPTVKSFNVVGGFQAISCLKLTQPLASYVQYTPSLHSID